MNDLTRQRCFNHLKREAAVRCPACHRFFCRECVTEHEDRMLCSSCLNKLFAPQTRRSWALKSVFIFFECTTGFLCAWLFFYFLGRILLALPDSFHDGSLWQAPWWMTP